MESSVLQRLPVSHAHETHVKTKTVTGKPARPGGPWKSGEKRLIQKEEIKFDRRPH